jgi:hypothetical protein
MILAFLSSKKLNVASRNGVMELRQFYGLLKYSVALIMKYVRNVLNSSYNFRLNRIELTRF